QASDGALSSGAVEVAIAVGGTGYFEAGRLDLSLEGAPLPGSTLTLHAEVTNIGNMPLSGVRLLLSPEGLSLVAQEGAAAGEAGNLLLPDLAVGEGLSVTITAQLAGNPGDRAGTSAM